MFIPRVGQEVLVQFLEGDPDRPVIIGRVYNGDNPVPHDLPNHKAVTTLRTASTPGGQGYNEIRFTDTAGHEEFFIHAQKNRREIIGHNDNCTIRANRTTTVAAQDTLQVGNALTIQAGSEIILKVGGSTVTITPSGITMTGTSLTSRASAMDVSAPAIQMNGQVKIN
jgi:type VI secretion system secreted protein VgrG